MDDLLTLDRPKVFNLGKDTWRETHQKTTQKISPLKKFHNTHNNPINDCFIEKFSASKL